MLNASDDILNQINCTDSSGEDGGKSLNQPKIRSCPTWNPPHPSLSTLLLHQRLIPPSQGIPPYHRCIQRVFGNTIINRHGLF